MKSKFAIFAALTSLAISLPAAAETHPAPLPLSEAVGAKPVTIALIDTGIIESPILAGRIQSEHSFIKSHHKGIASEHGTWVAGVVAKNATADVRFISLRADRPRTCSRTLPLCQIDGKSRVAAVEKAADLGVDMILITSGGPYSSQFKKALHAAMDSGIEVVVSAGNDGGATRGPGGIKHSRFHIVAALDKENKRAEFSNFSQHKSLVWRLGVDVETQSADGQTIYRSGTSYAAPLYAAELANKLTFNTSDLPIGTR